MPWYIGDYLADTMHLTRDQHGGYMLLIMAYWRRGGPLPDDDDKLAGIVKATAAEWRKLRPVLAEFFQIEVGTWIQKRAQIELDDATKITNDRSTAGSKGAAKRWRGHKQTDGKEDGKPGGNTVANRSQNDAPLPSQPQQAAAAATTAVGEKQFHAAGAAVLDLIGAARPLDYQRIRAWLAEGADPERDILPAIRDVLARERKADPQWEPRSLKYFDGRVAEFRQNRTVPLPKANGGSAAPSTRPRFIDKAAREAELAAARGEEVPRAPKGATIP